MIASLLVSILASIDEIDAITIVPIKPYSKPEVELARRALARTYRLMIRIEHEERMPTGSYYKPRNRFRADRIISSLLRNGDGDIKLGITTADISTTSGNHKDWGVFGLGYLGKPACVVSSFRLHKDRSKFESRFQKVVIHEVGHNFGLPHCPTSGCIMCDANGKSASMDNEKGFCSKCRRTLVNVLK